MGLEIIIPILMAIAANVDWAELIKTAIQLITKQQPKVESGEISGTQAREENLQVMREVTAQSPALPDWVLLIAHEVAWLEYAKEHLPEKYQEYKDRIENWVAAFGAKNYIDPNYVESVSDNVFGSMELFTSRPDKKK